MEQTRYSWIPEESSFRCSLSIAAVVFPSICTKTIHCQNWAQNRLPSEQIFQTWHRRTKKESLFCSAISTKEKTSASP